MFHAEVENISLTPPPPFLFCPSFIDKEMSVNDGALLDIQSPHPELLLLLFIPHTETHNQVATFQKLRWLPKTVLAPLAPSMSICIG